MMVKAALVVVLATAYTANLKVVNYAGYSGTTINIGSIPLNLKMSHVKGAVRMQYGTVGLWNFPTQLFAVGLGMGIS